MSGQESLGLEWGSTDAVKICVVSFLFGVRECCDDLCHLISYGGIRGFCEDLCCLISYGGIRGCCEDLCCLISYGDPWML